MGRGGELHASTCIHLPIHISVVSGRSSQTGRIPIYIAVDTTGHKDQLTMYVMSKCTHT